MSQVNYIYWETLVWLVDGFNKVFTSLYPIDRVEDLRLGSIPYSKFSFSWNTVTLQDAPTIEAGAPELDYFRSDVVVPVTDTEVTFWDVINSIYLRIGQDKTSYQFPIELVKEYTIEALTTHSNMRVNPIRNTGIYTFNKSKDYNAVGYSATEVKVSSISPYVPSQGKLLLEFQAFINYGTKSADWFGSLSGLEYVYPSNCRVNVGYKLPAGVKKPSEVTMDWVKLSYVDYREYTTRNKFNEYTIFDGYLFLPRTLDDRIVSVSFVKNTVIPQEETDILDFEKEYLQVFKLYVMKEIYADREEDRYAVTEKRYQDAWRKYKSYISRQADGIRNVVQSSAFKNL